MNPTNVSTVGRRLQDVALEPWHRQPGERARDFDRFTPYLAMGSARSIDKVSAELRVPRSTLARLSVKHGWVDRARAYDEHLDRTVLKELEAQVLTARKRIWQQARATAQTLMLPSIALSRKIAAAGGSAEALEALSIGQLMKLAVLSARALPGVLRAEAVALGINVELSKGLPGQAAADADTDALEIAFRAAPDARVYLAMAVEAASGASQSGHATARPAETSSVSE